MAKRVIKPKVKKTPKQPEFYPQQTVQYLSLVVDLNGVAWWVDPAHGTIRLAKVT